MYGGRAEQTIPLSRLSDSSVALAKRLQGLLQKKHQAQAKLAKERKNMKIPELSPEDLKRYLVWTNSTGDEIEAAFVDAGTSGVTVLMKQNPNRPIEIPWEKLSPESQAMDEGLKQLKIKLAPKAPRLGPYIEGKRMMRACWYPELNYPDISTENGRITIRCWKMQSLMPPSIPMVRP